MLLNAFPLLTIPNPPFHLEMIKIFSLSYHHVCCILLVALTYMGGTTQGYGCQKVGTTGAILEADHHVHQGVVQGQVLVIPPRFGGRLCQGGEWRSGELNCFPWQSRRLRHMGPWLIGNREGNTSVLVFIITAVTAISKPHG